ncbi:thiamine pyrophosphate-binding protein [Arthrobacter sp. UM1]|uniref:thiamine pyrophosphate-binding protein n=1 Tax=Arthrobacter sp. UM1 TaxID=2766776 RepID=UPI001CF6F03C|nr:thiamine pyrophosphate-binding protein [Arthrobacter sp. UM1]MCB4208866.1 thiamine pyrophosphate-binding protein [Arthrobacter sp. UM1]
MTGPGLDRGSPWATVADELASLGTDLVYGLPDDSMGCAAAFEKAGITLVVTAEQRTAVYAAAGASQAHGGFGAAVAGRGPATAALVPALLEASSQGSPIVVLVETAGEEAVPGLSFQCVSPGPLLRPVCKDVVAWTPGAVVAAKQRAEEAPAGPVAVLVPTAVGTSSISEAASATLCGEAEQASARSRPPRHTEAVEGPELPVFSRPVIVAGGGCRRARIDVAAIAEQTNAPVFVTASGRGCVDEDHPSFMGLAGLYTSPPAREIWQSADGVIALGSELEETAVEFLPSHVPVHQIALHRSSSRWPGRPIRRHLVDVSEWSASDAALAEPGWRRRWEDARSRTAVWAEEMIASKRVPAILDKISALIRPGDSAVFENGAADIWAYSWPVLRIPRDVPVLALSEQTTLGASIPAAAALARARSEGRTWSFSGDGAFIRSTLEPMVTDQPRTVHTVFDDGGYGWLAEQARAVGLDPEPYASGRPRRWHDAWGRPMKTLRVESAADVERLAPHIEDYSREHAVVLHVPVAPEDRSLLAQGEW